MFSDLEIIDEKNLPILEETVQDQYPFFVKKVNQTENSKFSRLTGRSFSNFNYFNLINEQFAKNKDIIFHIDAEIYHNNTNCNPYKKCCTF